MLIFQEIKIKGKIIFLNKWLKSKDLGSIKQTVIMYLEFDVSKWINWIENLLG